MSEVADLALSRSIEPEAKWQLRRLQGDVAQAATLLRSGDYISCRSKLERAASGLVELISNTTWVDRQNAIDFCRQVHDLLWTALDRDASVSEEERFRVAIDMLGRRDFRSMNFQRMVQAAKGAALARLRRRNDEHARAAAHRILSEAREVIAEAAEYGRKPMFDAMQAEIGSTLDDLSKTFGRAKQKPK